MLVWRASGVGWSGAARIATDPRILAAFRVSFGMAFLAAVIDAVFGAGLITTEKDWARLDPEWRPRVLAWPIRAVFEDEAALDRLLASAVADPPAQAPG